MHGLLQANVWLVRGRDRDLLIDSGLGIASLRSALAALALRDPVLVLTHAHLDHMGPADVTLGDSGCGVTHSMLPISRTSPHVTGTIGG